MNKIKHFGVICLVILFFASSGDAQQSFQGSLNFCLGNPQGKFKNNVDSLSYGGTGQFVYNFPRSSISVGASFGVLAYGSERRTESFSTQTLDFDVDEVTTNMILMCHFLLRIQPQTGTLRPYLDGLVGFNYIWTITAVKSYRYGEMHNIASSNIQNDFALSWGGGGGVMIRMFSKKRKGNSPFVIYIDLGAHYVWSREAEYMKEGSIYVENDQVFYDIYRSTTDLITGHIGVTFAF